mgnify:CR=1 FL=1
MEWIGNRSREGRLGPVFGQVSLVSDGGYSGVWLILAPSIHPHLVHPSRYASSPLNSWYFSFRLILPFVAWMWSLWEYFLMWGSDVEVTWADFSSSEHIPSDTVPPSAKCPLSFSNQWPSRGVLGKFVEKRGGMKVK